MGEKIIELVLSLLAKTKDKLIIQTKNQNDPAITALATEGLLSYVRNELEDRKKLGYPPYKRFIKITFLGDEVKIREAKTFLTELFKEYDPLIFSGFLPKFKGKFVTNALIKIDPEKWSLPSLTPRSSLDENLLTRLLSLPPSFSINIDPEDLM